MDSQKVTQRCNSQPVQHLLGAFENSAFCIFFITQGDMGPAFKAFQLIPTLWLVGPTVRQTFLLQTGELSQWNWVFLCFMLGILRNCCPSSSVFLQKCHGYPIAFAENITVTHFLELLSDMRHSFNYPQKYGGNTLYRGEKSAKVIRYIFLKYLLTEKGFVTLTEWQKLLFFFKNIFKSSF